MNNLRNTVFDKAAKLQSLWLEQGTSFIIDTTAADASWVLDLKKQFEGRGYETMMIYVDVPLGVAQHRNASRERSIPDAALKNKHAQVSGNRATYEAAFKHFIAIENAGETPKTNDPTIVSAFRKVAAWTQLPK